MGCRPFGVDAIIYALGLLGGYPDGVCHFYRGIAVVFYRKGTGPFYRRAARNRIHPGLGLRSRYR